jgi:hypothetical protein
VPTDSSGFLEQTLSVGGVLTQSPTSPRFNAPQNDQESSGISSDRSTTGPLRKRYSLPRDYLRISFVCVKFVGGTPSVASATASWFDEKCVWSAIPVNDQHDDPDDR